MTNRAGPPPVAQATTGREVATLTEVVGGITARSEQFALLVGPEHVERWKTVALHALSQNNRVLRECSAVSIIEAIRDSAAMNLSPTGLMGEGWIIPYKGVAQFQAGWRGYLKLLRNSGQYRRVDSQVVYMNDEFSIEFGTDPKIVHRPILFGEKNESGELVADRGDFRGVYCWAEDHYGEKVIEWMPWADVMAVARRSRSFNDGPWQTDPGEMGRKTVIRRMCKRLPLDAMPQVALAVAADERMDQQDDEQPAGAPATARATAAAFAPAEASGDPSASDVCGALTPEDYEEGGSCIRPLGHDEKHRDQLGQTWS